MATFSFSFSGDDIEDQVENDPEPTQHQQQAAETGTLRRASRSSAFPIPGQALLPAKPHSLTSLLDSLPSKISYSTLEVKLDDGNVVKIPRRELWDVRLQLMAEDGLEKEGLGQDDVKTGVYEGGFKSWECSVDLVRVLAGERENGIGERVEGKTGTRRRKVVEMGCGTALPSLALLQWQWQTETGTPLDVVCTDYNPSVLALVTVPNILLSWAQCKAPASSVFELEGELDIDETLLSAFQSDLIEKNISLSFISGAWSPEFVDLVAGQPQNTPSENNDQDLLVIAAETIYSPFALQSFSEALMKILEDGEGREDWKARALVGAKKVYFGVGGSIEDFVEDVEKKNGFVRQIKEEEDGVRRAVVEVMADRGYEGRASSHGDSGRV